MKLNKKGWGLGTFLIFIGIFILCLLFSAWGFRKVGLLDEDWHFVNLNDYFSGRIVEFDYGELENKMIDASKKYVNDFYNNKLGIDTLNVKVKTLVDSNYLEPLKDRKDRDCSGYVSVYNKNGKINYDPYLKCKRYKTSGYESRKDS